MSWTEKYDIHKMSMYTQCTIKILEGTSWWPPLYPPWTIFAFTHPLFQMFLETFFNELPSHHPYHPKL